MDNYYHVVLQALTQASSQNAELLKISERQLKSWENEKGFYSILLSIASDKSIDVNIRWLAALCIKNGVDRYWRKLAPNVISNEEKQFLRQQLMACLNEPVNQIALQFAVIISKIARFDFNREWPDLFPSLLNATQSPDQLCQLRALLIMHHVIKTLASKRLVADRHLFQQLTSTIFSNILHQWINYSKTFLKEVTNEFKSRELLESSFLSLKILRKLIVYGFKNFAKDQDAVMFISLIFEQIRPFIDCRNSIQNRENIKEICEKYLVLLIKILRDVIEIHPFSYVQFIRPTLESAVTFCFSKEFEDLLFERLIVQFLNLIKAVITCQEYKPAKAVEDTKNPLTLEANKIKREIFSHNVLSEICHQLISRYFLLSEEDVTNWENNPEDFASDEGGESWKFSLRPCTEVLFLSLFREFRSSLTPLVVKMAAEIQYINTFDFLSILRKEAVYNAIGLAAFDLYDEVDFDEWFIKVLVPEFSIKERGYYIIRRRVIWLIGQWVGVKMSPDMRPSLYEIILQLLNTEENLVVRLAAANTLKIAVDDFEFNTEQYIPYLERSISQLFVLLKEIKECDLKMSVLHVLSFIIERVGIEIRPYAECLMLYLPQLWEKCDHNMLRCAIISCFVHLVQGLGIQSESLHLFLLPMIALSTDVSQPPHVYLLEDGLDLWWAILENTSQCSPPLLDLANNLIPLLEYNSENLKTCLHITESYIILSAEAFLKRYGHSLVEGFRSAITDMKSEALNVTLKVIETAFIVFPEDAPLLFQPLLPYVLSLTLQDNELPISLSIYLSLLSRVILHNKLCFANVLQEKANEYKKDVSIILGELLDVWLEKMPLINPIQRRKLLGLALTSLITSDSEIIHHRLCGIFLAVVEVLNDITKCDSESQSDLLVMRPEDFQQQDEVETEQDKRKRDLTRLDPVYTVVLKDYLNNQVSALQEAVGVTKFSDLMSTVDVETFTQLKEYLQ